MVQYSVYGIVVLLYTGIIHYITHSSNSMSSTPSLLRLAAVAAALTLAATARPAAARLGDSPEGDRGEAQALPGDGVQVDTTFGSSLLSSNSAPTEKVVREVADEPIDDTATPPEATDEVDDNSGDSSNNRNGNDAPQLPEGSPPGGATAGEAMADKLVEGDAASGGGGGGGGGDKCFKISVKSSEGAGDVVVQLDPVHAPKSVENFEKYVDSNYYAGTAWHRVIDGFMIQGGGFDGDALWGGNAEEKPGAFDPIPDEHTADAPNLAGTLAMARTSDPNSATSQFFINLVDNDSLDQDDGYAVFGKVVTGFDIVQAIGKQPTSEIAGMADCPTSPVTIETVAHVQCPPPDTAAQ